MKGNQTKIILLAGILLILGSIIYYWQPWQMIADSETRTWEVTLVGRGGSEMVLNYQDIKAMPSYQGQGGFFSTVGAIFGPYEAQGVTLEDLGKLVGGITPQDVVMVSAQDGYSTVLDYEQVMGEYVTYDTRLKEVPHEELKTILMYRQDGRLLRHDDGKPYRLAVVGNQEGLLVEGNYWVKWVDRIEIMQAP